MVKKSANLSINSQLLQEARALNINLSATLERALTEEVRIKKQAQWREENHAAIARCNAHVEEHGLFSDKYRVF